MGAKWSTVSTSTYADGSPSDDGSATSANRVKFATIKTDLTDPLDTAIDSIVSKLDQRFEETTTAISTNYTTVASDHARVLEVTGGTITLLAAATAGVSYRVGVYASGASITVARTSPDTIDGVTSFVVSRGSLVWFVVNAAGDGYVSSAISCLPQVQTMVDVSTGSPTSAQFLSIPAWVRRMTLILQGVQCSGGNSWRVQVGSGSMSTSGYLGSASAVADGSTPTVDLPTAGWEIKIGAAAAVVHGSIRIELVDAATFRWVASGTFARSDAARMLHTAGSITLAGVLDRIRVVTQSSETFSAGRVQLLLE